MERDKVWLDRVVTPLNACSLETYVPILSDDDGDKAALPLVIGCYQLNEQSDDKKEESANNDYDDDDDGDDEPKSSSRSGELRLYMINKQADRYEPVEDVVQMESGVLDGKWRRRCIKVNCQSTSTLNNSSSYTTIPLFASACASGRVHLHSLMKQNNQWNLSHVTSSNEPTEEGLCLSLAWNDFVDAASQDTDQIVSSYSNGTVALHKVFGEINNNNAISIEETHRWNAHTLFGCPAEVWTCSFLKGDANVVLSGADDVTLKVWDIRQTQKHIQKVGESEFEAGVTAISPHPKLDHVFAVGSYDEYVRVYDYRKMNEPLVKCHVGGGVWRIKWHPSNWHDGGPSSHDCVGKMLIASMHGGCRVVDVTAEWDTDISLSSSSSDDATILSKFTAHESMAVSFTAHESMCYGADWICLSNTCETAASCSFYDRQAFIWEPDKAVYSVENI